MRSEPDSRLLRTVLGLFAFTFCLQAFVAGYSLLTMTEFEYSVTVPGYTPGVHEGLLHYLLDPWQRWDGQWFGKIAQKGYAAADGSAAFLPAYPFTVRAVAVMFGGDTLAAGCVVSWVTYFLALWLLGRLFRLDDDEDMTSTALMLLVTFPTAMFFHAAYSESLFLLLSVFSLWSARRGAWLVAGVSALGATLTRWTGFGLVPALLVEAWLQATKDDGAPTTLAEFWRRELAHLPRLRSGPLVGSLIPALALPIVLFVQDRALGDPWAFQRAQRLWERHWAPPWTGIIDGVLVLLPGFPPHLEPLPGGFPRLPFYWGGFLDAHAYNLVSALGAIALTVIAVKTIRASYTVWALAAVLLPLMTPSRLQPLQSMPRFFVVMFPLFLVMAHLLKGRPLLTLVVVASFATLQGFFTARFALWYWVA